MAARPEVLFPLFRRAGRVGRDRPQDRARLCGVGHCHAARPAVPPATWRDRPAPSQHAWGLEFPAIATVEVVVGAHHAPRTRGRPYRVFVQDAEMEFQLVFFHARGDYLQKLLPTGQRRVVSGKVELFDGIAQMVHPDHVLRPDDRRAAAVRAGPRAVRGRVAKGHEPRDCRRAGAVPHLEDWIDPALKAQKAGPTGPTRCRMAHAPQGLATGDRRRAPRAACL